MRRILNQPLHPFLVHLPIGLWVASLLCDLIYKVSGNANLAVTSFYCMLLGMLGALLAAPAGIAEYVHIPSDTAAKRIATLHFILNGGIIVLYLLNLSLRFRLSGGVPAFVTTGQLILSLGTAAVLVYSGYLGGLLVYRYGVGRRVGPSSLGSENEIKRVA